jgi:hypothetical protein
VLAHVLLRDTYFPTIRFDPAAVPDDAQRARFDALASSFFGKNVGLCDGCEPAYEDGAELPSEFQRKREALAQSLGPAELQAFVELLLIARDTGPFDGAGHSDFEMIFFEPVLQPAAMRALTTDLLARAQRRDVFGIGEHVLAEMALEAPADAVPLFREIVAWPCELDVGEAPGKGTLVATWTDKTLAAAALTRVGTADDTAGALATIEHCAFAEGTADPPSVKLMVERLRAAPTEPAASRHWFEDSFGDWLDSD